MFILFSIIVKKMKSSSMDNNFQDFKAYQMKLIVKMSSYFIWCMYLSLERHKFEKKIDCS